MALFGPTKRASKPRVLQKSSKPIPKPLFEQKKQWHRKELRRRFKKASPFIPGAGGSMYRRPERKKMIDEIFPYKRFGSHIRDREVRCRLRELRREVHKTPTGTGKRDLRRKIRYLERELDFKRKY